MLCEVSFESINDFGRNVAKREQILILSAKVYTKHLFIYLKRNQKVLRRTVPPPSRFFLQAPSNNN